MSSDTPPTIRLEVGEREEGRLARITVDNTQRLNILNTPLLEEFQAHLEELGGDERLRLVVLTGAGDRAFIGGADIDEMVDLEPTTAQAFITRLHGVCQGLRALPVPVVARISGYCLGAGLEVAASCDLRAAAAHARFGMPEVQVGLPSVIEAALLPRIVSWGRAAELVYTGKMIDASEAAAWGLVERVVPREELDAAIDEWAEAILTAGPRAIRLQKRLVQRWQELPLEEAIEAGIATFAEAYRSDEPKLWMKRFLERRRG